MIVATATTRCGPRTSRSTVAKPWESAVRSTATPDSQLGSRHGLLRRRPGAASTSSWAARPRRRQRRPCMPPHPTTARRTSPAAPQRGPQSRWLGAGTTRVSSVSWWRSRRSTTARSTSRARAPCGPRTRGTGVAGRTPASAWRTACWGSPRCIAASRRPPGTASGCSLCCLPSSLPWAWPCSGPAGGLKAPCAILPSSLRAWARCPAGMRLWAHRRHRAS
mmetsp:Transcript_70116/g.217478  ORF Transcript_70116/g.217478 Transcript_70116/m.217478 type:complete len:221 (-) Transcript_70116:66-728(-)